MSPLRWINNKHFEHLYSHHLSLAAHLFSVFIWSSRILHEARNPHLELIYFDELVSFSLTEKVINSPLIFYFYYNHRSHWRKECKSYSFWVDVIWIKLKHRLGGCWEAAFIFIGTSQPKLSNSETFGLGNAHNAFILPAVTDELAGSKECNEEPWQFNTSSRLCRL